MDERTRELERKARASRDPAEAAVVDASMRRSGFRLRDMHVERLLRDLLRLGESIRRVDAREIRLKEWHRNGGSGADSRVSLRFLGDADRATRSA